MQAKSKIAIVLLTKDRKDLLKEVLEWNIPRTGVPCDLIIVDNGSTEPGAVEYITSIKGATKIMLPENTGIAHGLNIGLKYAYDQGYDYFQIAGNDILEQEGWVAEKLRYLKANPSTGMISIRCINDVPTLKGEWPEKPTPKENAKPDLIEHVVGQFMLTREVVDLVGFFTTKFTTKYAPIDNDYNNRCNRLGLVNYYIPGFHFKHLGNEVSTIRMYGYSKQESINVSWKEHQMMLRNVYTSKEKCKIPYEPYTIFEKEYPY